MATARDIDSKNDNGTVYAVPIGRREGVKVDLKGLAWPLSVYKNQGWYATGSVYEVWLSYGGPVTTPPSGHTLTNLQHDLLDPQP